MTIETTTTIVVPMWNNATLYVEVPCVRNLETGETIINETMAKALVEAAVLEYEKESK